MAKAKTTTTPATTPKLTIDDMTYEVSTLPEDIQAMLAMYQALLADKEKAQFELNKCEAAIRGISTEITTKVRLLKRD